MESIDDKYIQVFDDALPSEYCEKIINMFETEKMSNKDSGKIFLEGESSVSELKQSLDFVMTYRSQDDLDSNYINNDWNEVTDYLLRNATDYQVKYTDRLKELGLDEFCKHADCFIYENSLLPRRFTFPQIQKTSIGEKFDWHSDYHTDRLCSFIYYFNDVEGGGETEFRGDKVIEPKRSRLVVFPSGWNYIHRGNPVLAGSKYIATCFSLYTPSVSSHDAD